MILKKNVMTIIDVNMLIVLVHVIIKLVAIIKKAIVIKLTLTRQSMFYVMIQVALV